MSELALKIDHVTKEYRLGTIGGATLRGELQSKMAKLRHKEDPNLKIGQKAHSKNERFLALDDVSLEIKKGERIGIIGHNGAGKSTLLKLICRVTAPTKGEIYLNGRITSMLEVGTGFHGELTGRENVYLNGAILGMDKDEINDKFDKIVEFSEVGQFIDTPVKRYSSGMHVKLGFAVASHLDSEIMIMDEVLAVGDMAFQNKCLQKMREAAEDEGRTILYVSHNMNTIRTLCDRVIVLDHGKIIYDGDVEEAIILYLGVKNELDQTRTFTLDDFPNWNDPKLLLKKVTLKNDIASLMINDTLHFEIDYHALKNLNDIHFRLVLTDESRRVLAITNSSGSYSFKKNQQGTIRIPFDTTGIACGTYNLRFSAFVINGIGTHEYFCVINEFFMFELHDNPEFHFGMVWNKSSWGDFCLPSFTAEVE